MFMKGKDGNYLGKFKLYPGVKVSLMVSRGISMLHLPRGNNKLTMLLWTVQGRRMIIIINCVQGLLLIHRGVHVQL